MRYILDVELIKGYEEMGIMMLDEIIKGLHDRGIIKINKQKKIGEPFFNKLEKFLDDEGFKSYKNGGCGCY